MNIVKAITDPKLFGAHFKDLESWAAWIVVLLAIFKQPMTDEQKALFLQYTGREYTLDCDFKEIWLIVGRRGGKSRIVALIAVWLALFYDYSSYLSAGERGHVVIAAVDKRQAQSIMRYIKAFLLEGVLLAPHVANITAETIELDNNIVIEVFPNNYRSSRGRTIVASINDEIAFWRSEESANPDTEYLNSIRPAMATIPNALLIGCSSPYARNGAMYDAHKTYYGEPDRHVLVWQAPTWAMNPQIPKSFLDREFKRDPVAYRSEYGAEFRTDIAAAFDPEWVDAALTEKNLNRPRSEHERPYRAFVDLSGGRSDAAAIAIAHMEPNSETVILDALASFNPPFSPEAVVQQMAELTKQYGVTQVTGDNYAAELVVELFSKVGLGYTRSEDSASEIYLNTIPIFSTGRVEGPDNPLLRRELLGLERKTRTGGRDLVTHAKGGHDDLANACCGAILAAWRSRSVDMTFTVIRGLSATYDGSIVDDVSRIYEEWED